MSLLKGPLHLLERLQSMKNNILVIGDGKLSKAIQKVFSNYNLIIFNEYNIDTLNNYNGDILIDCSSPNAFTHIYNYLLMHKIPTIIATTNFTKKQDKEILSLSNSVPIFKSDNFSLGISILNSILSKYKYILKKYDIHLIDFHHKNKKDSPSGTSKKMISLLDNNVQTYSIRSKELIGKHELHFINEQEEIVITHEAFSRELFANGILLAYNFISKKNTGLYTMEDLINELF